MNPPAETLPAPNVSGDRTDAALILILAICVALMLLIEGYETRQRNKIWKDDLSLWTATVEKSPRNGRALMNLGVALMSRGRYPEAEYYFERAKLQVPFYSTLEVNLGVVNAATGHVPEAEFHFQQALALGPRDADSYTFYQRWLHKWGRHTEERAIELHAISQIH